MAENEIDKLGYQHACAPANVPDNETTERKRFDELPRSAVARIKQWVPFDVRVATFKQVQRLNSPGLIECIKNCYQLPSQERGRLAIDPEKHYYISGFNKAI